MLFDMFPDELHQHVQTVVSILPQKTMHGHEDQWYGINEYQLDRRVINFPDRIYRLEPDDEAIGMLDEIQIDILSCFYTRSADGFVREKYLRRILNGEIKDWEIPFIVKLSDEYVVEILEIIYKHLYDRNNDDFKAFCRVNKDSTYKSFSRMMSYWDAYYRRRFPDFQNYVGRRLFCECYGYTQSYHMKTPMNRSPLDKDPT